jgi:hypothetical protein
LLGLGVAVLVVVIVGLLVGSWAPAIVVAVTIAALTLVIGYLRRIGTKYLITTQRLRISRGLVRKNVQAARAGSERELPAGRARPDAGRWHGRLRHGRLG